MALSLFEEDAELNEHEIAWKSRDLEKIQQLADSFKEKPENELFAIMNNLGTGKKERTIANSDYSRFWIDNSFSQHVDCLLAVNAMNLLGAGLSDQSHHNYYLHAIPQAKRFGKWAKYEENAASKFYIKLIAKYHQINDADAYMYYQTYKEKGNLELMLKKLKGLVTDEFLKTVTKNVKEQKQFKKQALEW